mmetsp:Transcript_93348/g.179510  ORF Transcript_93348/g.179510 Transcript_93348/m.179510 type:complete len:389 (+) Transcript_93348:12-1178(+)
MRAVSATVAAVAPAQHGLLSYGWCVSKARAASTQNFSKRTHPTGSLALPGDSKEEARVLEANLKQMFGRMGVVSHKRVGILDLYRIMRVSRSEKDYQDSLSAMNLFYNFGVKLHHREVASRLLATAMRCKCEKEAVELIKLYSSWLEHPPDTGLIYAVMGHFLDAGQPLVVREVAKAVREDWRLRVEPPLYILAIEAMLQLPDDPVGEALELYEDARLMGVRLPAPLHNRLLAECLGAFEKVSASAAAEPADGEDTAEPQLLDDAAVEHLRSALTAADGLARDGHLFGGASAASLCSLAWLHWHLAAVPVPVRTELVSGADPQGAASWLGGDWERTLEVAVENFGCHWGFSSELPRGFFRALEASSRPDADRLVEISRRRFGRFYPHD